ncbi:MAG: hypothetical protein ACYTFX_09115 [Planctomycetota bacterium]
MPYIAAGWREIPMAASITRQPGRDKHRFAAAKSTEKKAFSE